MEVKIEEWIDSSGEGYIESRRAIHIILKAISGSEELSASMILKGGTLLGIRYGSSRFTTDVDFSTGKKYKDLDPEAFKAYFNESLEVAAAELNYGLRCNLQSWKVLPNASGTFPTVKIKIGYSPINDRAKLKRFEVGQAVDVVNIDYSFNEETYNSELIKIDDESGFVAYSIVDLIAEKFRSVLQQKVRGRGREQDIYDLNYLFSSVKGLEAEAYKILESLLKKSVGKNIDEWLCSDGMKDPEIKDISRENYHGLKDTVDYLPDFDESYDAVSGFYEELPWEMFGR